MNFISMEFLVSFPVLVLLYWQLSLKKRPFLLLTASCLFYIYWNAWSVAVLFAATLLTYLFAIAVEKCKTAAGKKCWLGCTVTLCVGVLVIFKSMGMLTGDGAIVIPVGISFYTFQTLSYVIEVYKGEMRAERDLGYYALFVSFFPQLVAGPIERPQNLLPQLHHLSERREGDLSGGLWQVLRGFYKKIVIADFFALYVDKVYGTPETMEGPAIVLATVLFAFQIYCDFSGYSDIAVGGARMMGIRLMENFREPYRAQSVREFWRRWHISLTSWLTDYVYKPLGGSRKGTARTCVHIMLVFCISGLWHGFAWNFFIWGALHGLYLVMETLFGKWLRSEKTDGKIPEMNCQEGLEKNSGNIPAAVGRFRQAAVFVLVCFAWIFFRANSPEDAGILIRHLGGGWNALGISQLATVLGMDLTTILRMLLVLATLPLMEKISADDAARESSKTRYFARTFLLVMITALSMTALLSMQEPSAFIYFQF